MSQPTIVEISGLQLSNNDFSASPPGSLAIASNIVMPQKGVAQPRNGQAFAATPPAISAAATFGRALVEKLGTVIASFSATRLSAYGLGRVNGTSVTAYTSFGGIFNPVDYDGASNDYWRMKFALTSGYLNFCTTTGPKVLETTTGQPRTAGLSRMPDPSGFPTDFFGPAWMPYNTAVAYRTVLRRATSNGVSLLSPPSGRITVMNRIAIPVAQLNKAGGVATAVTPGVPTGLLVGDVFTLTPGEADFPGTAYTVTSVTPPYTFTFNIGAGTAASTDLEDADVGMRAVQVRGRIPISAVAGDYLRLYRSNVTSNATVDPSDELFLCAEHLISSGDIGAGYFDFQDTTPQFALSDPLYTNAQTSEGALSANYQPPIYRDVTAWNGQTWYLNTTDQQGMALEMLGVGLTDGIQDGDTITIADSTNTLALRFKNTVSVPTDVQIYSDGTPSQNIQVTAANLVQTFYANAPGGAPWAMYNNSADGSIPGKLLLQRVDFVNDPLKVKVSRPATWSPGLSSSTYTLSDNNRQPNGLYASKAQQAEAVPPSGYSTVGAKNFAGRRIFGLRNALIIFKEGDGVWAQTGTEGAFQLRQISTANIIAPDCAAVFADMAWAYTDQGIIKCSDTGGVTVVSRPIETELNRLDALFPDDTYASSFAVAYETERRILFYMPQDGGTVGAPLLQAWCLNLATSAWTRFNYTATAGVVTQQPRLWMAAVDQYLPTLGILTEERKTETYLDFADETVNSAIIAKSVGGNSLLIQLSASALVAVGDGITQGQWATKVVALRPELGTNVIAVAEAIPWSASPTACTLYKSYPVEIQFQPMGNPTSRKVLTRLALFYKPGWYANLLGDVTIFTDQIQAESLIPAPSHGFGLTPFGTGPFGNPTPLVVDTNPLSPTWTNAAQFFPGFAMQEVWCKLKLQGVYMLLGDSTAPAGRGG